MNSIIRRSNRVTPNFSLNDSSPTSFQKKQKLEILHAEIQGEQLSEFAKKYRMIVRQESLINSPTHQSEQVANNLYQVISIKDNQLQSRQTLDMSELNEENYSRVSFEILSPLKRTSKSLGIIKNSSAFPQFSTCISLQNNSDMKSPQYSSSLKKIDLISPTQRSSLRQNQLESFRSASESVPIIKMQNTFYSKQNKIQNQQFLEKCFGSVSTRNSGNGFTTPGKSQKYIPFNISNTSKMYDRRNEASSFYKAVRVQDMDFLTRLNNESSVNNKTELSHNKSQRATSLTESMRSKQSSDRFFDKKRDNSCIKERMPELTPKKVTQLSQNSETRSKSTIFTHKEIDFTMNNPQNFTKHLQSLQDLSQSDRKRRKIRGLVDQMIKDKYLDNESDSNKKPFKIVLHQDAPNNSSQKASSRRSSIEISEQLHYFKKPIKDTVIREEQNKSEKTSHNLVSLSNINILAQSQKLITPHQSSLTSIAEKNTLDQAFEEKVQYCKKVASETFNQYSKLLQLNISRQKIIKLLKSFLSGNSPVLNILLDENKINLSDDVNVQMLEDLIIPQDIQNIDAHLIIEHELIFLTSKIEEYILQLDIQQCEIYKSEILNGCQSLQEMASNVNKRNKSYAITAFKTLDNLSFMGNGMLNKQHSVIDQIGKAQIKFGNLGLVNQQNLNMNSQIENKIDKMVKQRQGQIKMLNIFSTKKVQQ